MSAEGLNRVSSERKQDWLQVLFYPCATEAAVMIAAYKISPDLVNPGIIHGCYSMRRRTRNPGAGISAPSTAWRNFSGILHIPLKFTIPSNYLVDGPVGPAIRVALKAPLG